MWRTFVLTFCCFMVAVTASERSPAKVRIHQERSSEAELIASVEALGKTHNLKLKRTSMPSLRLQEVNVDDNGRMTVEEVVENQRRKYFEDEQTGAFLFMNDDNTLEGMVSDSVALHYEDKEHTASEVTERNAGSFCDVSGNSRIDEELSKLVADGEEKAQARSISFVVEVLAYADSTLRNYKASYFEEYMRVYWKMVDRRFRTVSGAAITIRLSTIMSCTNVTCDAQMMDAQDQTYAQLTLSKNKFATYLANPSSNLPPFDVAHLMTKRDLFEWNNGVRDTHYHGSVMAIGAPCLISNNQAQNSGISEDDGLWTGALDTAHQIGHNLGAHHDGEGPATSCPWNGGFLMSTVRNSFVTFWFSQCSSNAMINTYCQSTSGCLNTIDDPTYETYPNYVAGNFRSVDTQCQWATQVSNAIADPNASAHEQCVLLKCQYVIGTTTMFFTSEFPALDGTPCSSGGYCKDGWCQASWQ